MGQGQVANQSGTSWYPVITASSYEVAVLVMSLINYITHQYTNTTQVMARVCNVRLLFCHLCHQR